MATPAEKKALIFVSVVALLGSGVRLWRLQHPSAPAKPTHFASSQDPDEVAPSNDHPHSSSKYPTKRGKNPKNTRSKPVIRRDSTSVIDLDRAPLPAIEALGVLKPGLARLIIADRDTFGPFGSFHELERVPYLNKSDLRALAPRVTFSLLPRPKNAVMFQRPDQDPPRQKRHASKGTPKGIAQ